MAWRIKFSASADKDFGQLDRPVKTRILHFLETRVAADARRTGKAMRGDDRAWRYRIGHYRIVCQLDDAKRTVFVVRIGHRSSVYEQR